MARINIVVPKFNRSTYSGGIWCILEYAHGLASIGHKVTVIPMAPSPFPTWFPHPIGNVIITPASEIAKDALKSLYLLAAGAISRKKDTRRLIRNLFSQLCLMRPGIFNEPIRWGIAEAYVLSVAPEADITLATSFETVRSAYLLTGKKFYFAQHYEPYFSSGFDSPLHADALAHQSYDLGFHLIANSSWLKRKAESEFRDIPISVCPNAIDHKVFCGKPKMADSSNRVIVISYGGRGVEWKGFKEMAQAVAIARGTLPDYQIEWRVYGDAAVGPEEITPYLPLGFLSQSQLSEEYRKADILLSASWYESFPLFPIEAMACGLAVVTTQFGTEDYAQHGITAEIVQPKDPQSISEGLLRLIRDPNYRSHIATGGNRKSQEFTWERSVRRLEGILLA